MAANRLRLMMQGLGMFPKRLKLDGVLRMEREGWGKGLKGKLYFILFTGVPVKSHQNASRTTGLCHQVPLSSDSIQPEKTRV